MSVLSRTHPGPLVAAVMETFRQRKSSRLALQLSKLPATVVVPRGLSGQSRIDLPASGHPTLAEKNGTHASKATVTAVSVRASDASLSGPLTPATVASRKQRKRSLDSHAAETVAGPTSPILEDPGKRVRRASTKTRAQEVVVPPDSSVPSAEEETTVKTPAAKKSRISRAAKPLKSAKTAPGDLEGAVEGAKKKASKLSQKAIMLTVGASQDRSVWSEESMRAAMTHLCQVDPKLRPVIERCGQPEQLWPKGYADTFASLTRNIVGQQLATAAAYKIYGRFLETCKAEKPKTVQPRDVLDLPFETLKACGLSSMKTNYLIDLANFFDRGDLSDEAIAAMDDVTLIQELTKVKGIGRWSVDMFTMFHLGRQDVLPIGDLGVRNGIKTLYGLKDAPQPLEMEALTNSWRPYRSLGSYYMWRVIEKQGAPKAKFAKPADKTPISADAPALEPMRG